MVDEPNEGEREGPFFVIAWAKKGWDEGYFNEEVRGQGGGKVKSGAGFTRIIQNCRKNQGSN